VGADLDVMRRDLAEVRGELPYLFTNCRAGAGLDATLQHILEAVHDTPADR
jgi:urease accessory protein